MNPCITTCPAIVPTEEEAKPEASRAMPKIVAAPLRVERASSPSKAPSIVSTPVRPPPWKSAAATTIIAMLTSPASARAITTSIFSKRRMRWRSRSLRPTIRFWVSAECR